MLLKPGASQLESTELALTHIWDNIPETIARARKLFLVRAHTTQRPAEFR